MEPSIAKESTNKPLDDQLEELSRIKLEDIDELNSYLSTEQTVTDPKVVQQVQQDTTNNQKQESFVMNIFRNVRNFSSKSKEANNSGDNKVASIQTKPSSSKPKACDFKLDIENNSILNVDFDDDLMSSLINGTQKEPNYIDPRISFQMEPQQGENTFVEPMGEESKHLLVTSRFDVKNSENTDLKSLLNVNTEVDSGGAIQNSLSFELYRIHQQDLNLDDLGDKEFFLDTDMIMDNSNHDEQKSKFYY